MAEGAVGVSALLDHEIRDDVNDWKEFDLKSDLLHPFISIHHIKERLCRQIELV